MYRPSPDSQLLDVERLPPSDLTQWVDRLQVLLGRAVGCDEESLRQFIFSDPGPVLRRRLSVVRRDGRLVGFTFYRLYHGRFGGEPGFVYESTGCSVEAVGAGAVGVGPVLRDALGYKLVHPRARLGHREANLHLWRLERAGVVHFPVRPLGSDQEIRAQLAVLGSGRLAEVTEGAA